MPLAESWNSKSAIKFEKKTIRKTEIRKKQAQKTSKFQLKQAQKQAIRKSPKKPQDHKKISPNSREKRKVGNTVCIITLSFRQVHVKRKRPQVLSLHSLVTIGIIQQR